MIISQRKNEISIRFFKNIKFLKRHVDSSHQGLIISIQKMTNADENKRIGNLYKEIAEYDD